MVRVNKKYLDKELQKKSWGRFLHAVKKSGTEEELIHNIKNFLTPTEVAMLEKRLAIPLLLERGLSYRAIGETIDVSSNTISFVKHNLTKKPVVHQTYSSHPPKQKKKLPILPPRVGHGRWLRAKLSGY